MSRPHVAVVGGGLAGITAAIALGEMGSHVTLLEARPRLGGATSSFRRGGLTIDNGQHVFLRCCTAYRGLLRRLGMTGAVSMQDRFDVTVLSPAGGARLRRSVLPGPLHMARALAGYGLMSPAARWRAVAAALAMTRLDPARAEFDGLRLGDWLAAHGQDERARRVLWDLFTVSTLNVAGDDANLALAAKVMRTALLSANDAADIGVPAVPLGDLHGRAAAGLLGRQGASVRVGAKVAAVEPLPEGGFRLRLADRGRSVGGRQPAAGLSRRTAESRVVDADAVVLAVPPPVAAALAPPGVHAQPDGVDGAPGPQQWRLLGTSPIVNVHVIYDRPVTRLPFVAAVDSPVQWVFDRTRPSGLRTGQYLAVSLSAADRYIDVPAARLRQEFLAALAGLFPAAREAAVTDFFVTRERRATLNQVPGCQRMRPPAATTLPGLVLAGAWTDTGWPDTMEGAVRSGLNAARALRARQW
ncbi:MAG TPA: hydroxysqualene dehydroxylase HpnE [Streptosporangiaceae bacterium]|nr:hydroxysqualene dehydroxylase HpnE [Streptosporangiaceae bacterium]